MVFTDTWLTELTLNMNATLDGFYKLWLNKTKERLNRLLKKSSSVLNPDKKFMAAVISD